MYNGKLKKNKINFRALGFLGILYLLATIVIPQSYSFLFLFLFLGYMFLYLLSPTIAFVYAFVFVIDPLDNLNLSGQRIVPIFLCLFSFLLNYKEFIPIISKDKAFVKLIRVCVVFTLYQLIVSLMLKQGQDVYYILMNVNYWLGIWVLVPAYIFTYIDRKNIFGAVIVVVFFCMLMYFLTFFNVFDLFKIREFNRSEDNIDIKRLFAFDLRFITKFFVFILPLFVFFPIKNLKLKYLVIVIGLSVYIAVSLSLLRTEMFYLFMGGVTAFLLSFFKFKKASMFSIYFSIVCGAVLVLVLFPNLIDNVIETFKITIEGNNGGATDGTLSHRLEVQLPIALKIFSENFLFGGGLFAVSPEATGGHYILFDIPYIAVFSAYGLIGMFIYYLRFIYIFSRYKIVVFSQKLYNLFPVESLLTNGIMAYFITMVFFKLIHFNIELAFTFGMPETGLFIGAFFGITRFLFEQNNSLNKNNI